MGESSACLVRSLSQPSPTSTDEKQSNPLQRALSSSVSFGRFMSESLDWEKWSTFTHNRYLEEVEKYKRPGSVAEKKAYFEDRYKRRKAEALLEEENEAQNDLPQMNETKKDEDVNTDVNVVERDIDSTMLNQEDKTEDKDAIVGDLESSGKKKPSFSSGKFSTAKNIVCSTPNSAKTIRGSTDKKRSTPRSLHQSINFDTRAQEVFKALSPCQEKIVNSRLIPTRSNKSKDKNAPPMLAKECSAISPRPENKSNSRSSVSTRESKAQPSTVPSSFVFRSEERAVKRKEFFQMLERKKNARETEKQQEKPKIDYRDLRHSVAFKAAPNKKVSAKPESPKVKKEEVKSDVKDLRSSSAFKGSPDTKASSKIETSNNLVMKEKPKTNCGDLRQSIACKVAPNGKVSDKIESPISFVKKIPKVQPCTQEIKMKVAPRPTWRFSAKTDSFKDVIGKNNRPPIYSVKSLAKKRQHENVSPNIQP